MLRSSNPDGSRQSFFRPLWASWRSLACHYKGAHCHPADYGEGGSSRASGEQGTPNKGHGRYYSAVGSDFEQEPVRIPITDVFDLHTVPPRDVKAVVEAYLEEAHALGFRYVRIIHGRGIGVQRETVRKVLGRTPFVESFSDAPAEAGGWGATIVTLKP